MPGIRRGRDRTVSRQHKDSESFSALNTAPIRYAIIEMGSYHDVKVFETCLARCCRKTANVSPDLGKGLTFAKKNAHKWPEYKQAIESCDYSGYSTDEPDWWYISGHHGDYGDGK
ncbi:MAG: hypothetical protein JSV50_08375 [Desulfobacteraceae bacterium]|nr:MAG: hypothetical protein JSV50_08375 [Desulfobacteraceae bacterium]